MTSKKSFFKAVLIKKNTARFWPAWALYLIVLFFGMILPLYCIGDSQPVYRFQNAMDFLSHGYQPVITFLFAILSALLHFSYLYSARSCNMMHAFPLKRSQLFASNYISGLCFLIVPQFLAFLIALPAAHRNGIPFGSVSLYLFLGVTCSFIFFTIAVFCCMLAGHMLAALVYCLVFNSAFVIFRALFYGIQTAYGYGLSGSMSNGLIYQWGDFFSPVVFIASRCQVDYRYPTDTSAASLSDTGLLADTIRLENSGALLLFCVAAAVLLLLSVQLYRKRQLECAGEMTAFRAVRPVIRWIVTACCGTLFGYLFATILFDRGMPADTFKPFLVFFVIFSFAWFIVTEMVLRKNFRIFTRRMWMEWGILTVILLCLFGAIKADAFHIVRYVPDTDDVAAVRIDSNYTVISNDEADIAQTVNLHRTFLTHKDIYQELERNWLSAEDDVYAAGTRTEPLMQSVTITYYMKNGIQKERDYYMPLSAGELKDKGSAASLLDTLETPESALRFMLGLNYNEISYTGGMFHDHTLTSDQAGALYRALVQDLYAGSIRYKTSDLLARDTYDGMYVDNGVTVDLNGILNGRQQTIDELLPVDENAFYYSMGNNITISDAYYNETGKDTGKTDLGISFYINENCSNTCALLEEYGLISDPSDLVEMQQDYIRYTYGEGIG